MPKTKKTTKRKNLTTTPALPLVRSTDGDTFVLSADTLKSATGSYKNSVRFVDLAIGLRNKLNFRRVVPNVTLPVAISGKTGRENDSWSVNIDTTNQILNIGCQQFTGTAYRRILAAVEKTGLVTLS